MNRIVLTASLIGLLAGCGGGGGSSDTTIDNGGVSPEGSTNITLADISGIWNATESTSEWQDIDYVSISSSGAVKDYDYMGDSFDQGDICYWLTENYTTITDNGGGQFVISTNDNGAVVSSNMAVTLNGTVLTMTYIDSFDDDDDGNTTETQTMTMTRASGLQESDFQPLCDDEGNLPSGSTGSGSNGITYVTNQTELFSRMEGEYELYSINNQYSTGSEYDYVGSSELLGSMSISGNVLSSVTDIWPTLAGQQTIQSYRFTLRPEEDGDNIQLADATGFDGCDQIVMFGMDADSGNLVVGYFSFSCEHTPQTIEVWKPTTFTRSLRSDNTAAIVEAMDTKLKAIQ